MNNPEVTMHDAQQSTGFNALDKAQATTLQLFDDVRAITWRLLHPKP